MKKALFTLVLLSFSLIALAQQPPAPTTIPPLATNVATGCNNTSIQCTYTDFSVPVGTHFYFVVAYNVNGFAPVSNGISVTATSGQSAVITWNPSTTSSPVVSYQIYRGAPPTNLQKTGVN